MSLSSSVRDESSPFSESSPFGESSPLGGLSWRFCVGRRTAEALWGILCLAKNSRCFAIGSALGENKLPRLCWGSCVGRGTAAEDAAFGTVLHRGRYMAVSGACPLMVVISSVPRHLSWSSIV